MHLSSLDDMKGFVDEFLSDKRSQPLLILDLGSKKHGPTYRQFFDIEGWEYKGLDLEKGENVDLVLKDPYYWHEIQSGQADVLISGQAFEHIEYFWLTIKEVARVLKPGGLCCIIAPSGGPEHRYPVDCWRFYRDGFSALAKYAGLEALKVQTQWEAKGYSDDSDEWANSILVARKNQTPAVHTKPALPGENFYECEGEEHFPRSLKTIAGWILPKSTVLELGPATGYFTRFLRESLGCVVDAVELSAMMAERAQLYCRDMWVADLDHVDLVSRFKENEYDYIILADVLEHLKYPEQTLQGCRSLLAPEGQLILSVPNISYSGVICELLQGKFDYRQDGLLDRTHVRFYTRQSLTGLLDAQNYKVDQLEVIKLFPENSEFKDSFQNIPEFLQEQIQKLPDSLTYQFLLTAHLNHPEGKKAAVDPEETAPENRRSPLEGKENSSVIDSYQEARIHTKRSPGSEDPSSIQGVEQISQERLEMIQKLTDAFGLAEKLALERMEEIKGLTASLEEAQSLALERMGEISKLNAEVKRLSDLLRGKE